MSDNIQANPSLPAPDNGPQPRIKFGSISIRKRKPDYLRLIILASVTLGFLGVLLCAYFYAKLAAPVPVLFDEAPQLPMTQRR